MAKKLTNEVLEKLVMESIEEMGDVNEILGAIKNWAMGGSKPASTPFGRKARPPKSGGASESEAVQLLQLIASDPKVPNNIKSQIADFLEYAPSTPELPASAVQPLKATGTAKLPDVPDESEIPTVKTSTAKGTGFSYSSPRATSGPTKGRMPAPSLTPAKKKVAESKMLEDLVAEVLAEMSKKKEEPKQPKKPVKK
jgi:hypothetical protein